MRRLLLWETSLLIDHKLEMCFIQVLGHTSEVQSGVEHIQKILMSLYTVPESACLGGLQNSTVLLQSCTLVVLCQNSCYKEQGLPPGKWSFLCEEKRQ